MSSHHFVKEGQEPALFILEALSLEFVEPFLEWVPFVLVADQALETVLQWGIKIDLVLHHKTPLQKVQDKLNSQSPVQILSCSSENEVTAGLQFLVKENYSAVNLIGTLTEALLEELETIGSQLQIGVFNQAQKCSAITSGKFEKWLPAGSTLHIHSKSPSSLNVQGLVQKESAWESINDGMVMIEAKPLFWVIEAI